jgi:hypothetical protein
MTTTPKERLGQILLALDVRIHRDEDIAHIAGTFQERAVLGTRPTKTLNGGDSMASQRGGQVGW